MKTSRKKISWYCMLVFAAAALAGASSPSKTKIASISNAQPPNRVEYYQNTTAEIKTGNNFTYAPNPIVNKNIAFAPVPPATDSTPARCQWHLRDDSIFTEIDTSAPVVYGNPNASPAYYDVEYAAEGEEDDNDTCVTTDACVANDTSVLKYVVYYPKHHDYSTAPLPCIIFFHPGGSSDCSNAYSQGFMPTMCTKLAFKGFICFNVEYRRGRIKDTRRQYRSVQAQLAQYRSSQDGRGAIRSILQIERNAVSGAKFKIDTANMFLAGASAGGLIVNTAAYYSKEMVADAFPAYSGSPTIEQVLGPIDADYYVGSPNIDFQPHIKGVLDMWTGISIPLDYYPPGDVLDFFNGSTAPVNTPALISFQGYRDEVFPFSLGSDQLVKFSPRPRNGLFDYNATDNCLLASATEPYELNHKGSSVDLFVGSCLNLYNIMNDLDILTELYVDCTAMHGVVGGDDFGTSATTKEEIWIYMVERTAVFFQAVMAGKTKATLGNSLFVECENFRERCNQFNDPCTNTLSFCNP